MKTIVRSKVATFLLVLAAFAAWVAGRRAFGPGWESHLMGVAAFFIVACFLPEPRKTTFFSRRTAIGITAFFIWLAGNQYVMLHPSHATAITNPMWRDTVSIGGPILSAFAVYWLSVFLIRGFRARPEYEKEIEVDTQSARTTPSEPAAG